MPAPNVLRGIVLMVVATGMYPVSDAFAKHLARDYSAAQILSVRHLVVLGFVVLFVLMRRRYALFGTARPGLHALRALVTTAMSIFMILSLRYMALADTTAVIFVGPLIVVALSAPMLGERVGIHRWSAVIVGFIGVLIIMRPGLGIMHWAASFALLAAVLSAIQTIFTRQLASTEHAITTMFFMASFGLVFLTPALPFVWITPPPLDFLLMTMVGLSSIVAQFGMIRALEYAPTSLLAPFSYFQIVGATGIGYLVWGDLPDLFTIIGMIVVVASGLYVAARERRLAQAETAAR